MTFTDRVVMIPSRLVLILGLHRIHPNYLTLTGLILAILAPLTAYYGYWGATVTLVALSSLLDALDGLVARTAGLQTRFGAFLDSMSDRISDASYILALHLLGADMLICYTLLVASYMVSYARARGEGIGVKLKGVGLVERQERVLIIILAALLTKINIMTVNIILTVLALLSTITVLERVYTIYKTTS